MEHLQVQIMLIVSIILWMLIVRYVYKEHIKTQKIGTRILLFFVTLLISCDKDVIKPEIKLDEKVLKQNGMIDDKMKPESIKLN